MGRPMPVTGTTIRMAGMQLFGSTTLLWWLPAAGMNIIDPSRKTPSGSAYEEVPLSAPSGTERLAAESWRPRRTARANESVHNRSRTVEAFMRRRAGEELEEQYCLPELDAQVRKLGFSVDPQRWVDKQMKPGSRLFAIGDSVMTQALALGRPALSCTFAQP